MPPGLLSDLDAKNTYWLLVHWLQSAKAKTVRAQGWVGNLQTRDCQHFGGVRGGSPAKKTLGLRLSGTHFLSLTNTITSNAPQSRNLTINVFVHLVTLWHWSSQHSSTPAVSPWCKSQRHIHSLHAEVD